MKSAWLSCVPFELTRTKISLTSPISTEWPAEPLEAVGAKACEPLKVASDPVALLLGLLSVVSLRLNEVAYEAEGVLLS